MVNGSPSQSGAYEPSLIQDDPLLSAAMETAQGVLVQVTLGFDPLCGQHRENVAKVAVVEAML